MEKLTEVERESYKVAFSNFDINGDGIITDQEMRTALFKLTGALVSDQELAKIMEMYDENKDGKVTFEEFVSASKAVESVESQKKGLRQLFLNFDANNDGFIDREELKKMLVQLKVDVNDKVVEEIINSTDENGDGKLNFEEFLKGFCKV